MTTIHLTKKEMGFALFSIKISGEKKIRTHPINNLMYSNESVVESSTWLSPAPSEDYVNSEQLTLLYIVAGLMFLLFVLLVIIVVGPEHGKNLIVFAQKQFQKKNGAKSEVVEKSNC